MASGRVLVVGSLNADLVVRTPRIPSPGETVTGFVKPEEDNRLPPPRSEIERVYKGEKIVVLVLGNGFEYEGAIYKTLSAVAKKITGQHCNGYHFFKLNKNGGDK